MRDIFVDRVTIAGLLCMLRFRGTVRTIWHFAPAARACKRLAGFLRATGLWDVSMERIAYRIGDVRDGDGRCAYDSLQEHARGICEKIKRETLETNPFLQSLDRFWAKAKVVQYLEHLLVREIDTECQRIGLVAWFRRTKLRSECSRDGVLVLRRGYWIRHLEGFAGDRRIKLLTYPDLSVVCDVVTACLKLLALLPRKVSRVVAAWRAPGMGNGKSPDSCIRIGPGQRRSARSRPTVMLKYNHRTLSFDALERSEFFWIEQSGLSYSDVILYGYVSEHPVTMEALDELAMRGIRIYGKSGGVPRWRPTVRMYRVFFRIVCRLAGSYAACIVRGHPASWYFVRHALALGLHYAYWYDFFVENHVRLCVAPVFNTHVGQTLAMDALGGVSAGYQFAISHIRAGFPTVNACAGENIQFVFSHEFSRRIRAAYPAIDQIVCTGFIYDSVFSELKKRRKRPAWLEAMKQNGAEFILCYFDGNTLNRWDWIASDEQAVEDYRHLLEWLLSDPSLGVIFKPKKSIDLFHRIHAISDLVDRARKTGRCVFLTSATLVGDVFPAEAASMADVCIGVLRGGSASFEAALLGVPSLLIDHGGRVCRHPFYAWGYGRVVFDSWDKLQQAVLAHRRRSGSQAAALGDWSSVLDTLDAYRDGDAGLRMGLYIHWIYSALSEGLSRETALAAAAEKFAGRWGDALYVKAPAHA